MDNENMEVVVEEKKTLKQRITENWKSILKIGGIAGGIGALALLVRKFTSEENDDEVYYDAPVEEADAQKNNKAA